jgi:hypothetical protein
MRGGFMQGRFAQGLRRQIQDQRRHLWVSQESHLLGKLI